MYHNVKHIFLLQVLVDDRLDNWPNCEESVASRQYLLKQSPVSTAISIVAFKKKSLEIKFLVRIQFYFAVLINTGYNLKHESILCSVTKHSEYRSTMTSFCSQAVSGDLSLFLVKEQIPLYVHVVNLYK